MRDRVHRAGRLAEINAGLEGVREAEAHRGRQEERLRVARELHDAVAHDLTVVVLQAGAARRVWEDDPAAARVAVGALAGVAQQTLRELRGRLRGEPASRGELTVDPLEALVAGMSGFGVAAELVRDAASTGLPAETERVVVLIVQEALTNVARHAAPARAHVRIERAHDGAVLVEVVDGGRDPGHEAPGAVPGSGTGLHGMAERVALEGGTLRHGPRGRGYAVEARLPVRTAVPA